MNQFGQAAANWDDNRSRKALAGTPHQPFAAQALPAASALNYREAKLTNLWPFLAVALALPVLASAQAAENPKREHALANKSEDELVAKIAEFGIKVWDELEKGVALEAKKDLHKLGATPSPQVSPSPSPSAPPVSSTASEQNPIEELKQIEKEVNALPPSSASPAPLPP